MDLTGYGYRRQKQAAIEHTLSGSELSPELSEAALRLLARLETKVALRETAARFPRVLNQIAAVWDRPWEANRCLDELVFDARGTRQGFPPSVVSEIASLQLFYTTRVFPRKADPWEQALLR